MKIFNVKLFYVVIDKYFTQARQFISNINKNCLLSTYFQMNHFAKFDGRSWAIQIYAIYWEKERRKQIRDFQEQNRNVDRLKYLINDHSIINQGKVSLPADKWGKNNSTRISKMQESIGSAQRFVLFYIYADKTNQTNKTGDFICSPC